MHQDPVSLAMLPALLPALLDFERTPGRYPLVLREPRLLFDQAHAILLLAVGRAVDGLADLTGVQEEEARRGARFFVRTALLRSGVDHYTLLGLPPGADTEQVRDHYRLMIRLTHPDFQASGEAWPADAASRINIANDVLSSAERRADYQASLETTAKPTAAATSAAVAPNHTPPRPQAVSRRLSLKPVPLAERWRGLYSTRAKWVVASVGALLSGAALVMLSPTDSGSLTARKPATVSDDTAAYIEPDASMAPATSANTPVRQVSKKAPVVAQKETAPSLVAAPTTVAPARTRLVLQPVKTASAPTQTARQMAAVAGPLSLTMDTRLSAPAPAAAELAVEPAPPTEATPRLTMQQVHPALTNVVGSLYNGRGESLMQWVGSDWRHLPANQAFVTQFNQWLSGQRVTQLGKVSFKSHTQGDSLVVDGLVEVHLQDASNQVQVRDLQLRAYFQPQDGRPVLTQLAASQAR